MTAYTTKKERAEAIVEAIEAFVEALIEYDRSYRKYPEGANAEPLDRKRDAIIEAMMKNVP